MSIPLPPDMLPAILPRLGFGSSHDRDLFVPLSINGKKAAYFIDTGAGISSLSESKAKRLGMEIHENVGKLGTSTSRQTSFRTAVAKKLVLGPLGLKNVAFAVFDDDQEPWLNLPPGQRGLIGIPVLVTAERILWKKDGSLELGSPQTATTANPNLLFKDDQLMTTVRIDRMTRQQSHPRFVQGL